MAPVLLPMCAATAKRTSADCHSSIFELAASGCYLVKFKTVSTPSCLLPPIPEGLWFGLGGFYFFWGRGVVRFFCLVLTQLFFHWINTAKRYGRKRKFLQLKSSISDSSKCFTSLATTSNSTPPQIRKLLSASWWCHGLISIILRIENTEMKIMLYNDYFTILSFSCYSNLDQICLQAGFTGGRQK